MEAVHAAKSQDLGVSDRLDRALRLAFFGNSRCISLLHVILDVARDVAGLDAHKLETDLKNGTARHLIFEDLAVAQENDVQGSPHVFLPGGQNFHNPGIEMHWEGKKGGFPVIEKDGKEIYEEIFELAL
jgi:predicted DsbA family dithiol-disulfide isomerase